MAITNELVFERWQETVRTGERPRRGGNPDGAPLSLDGNSVLATPDGRLFSYGTHFEMARPLRYPDGGLRAILLNGDRYSVTTSGHQSQARGAAAGLGVDRIIVPYSALDAAGIDRDSIEPVHVRPDRNEVLRHSSEEQPGRSVPMEDPGGATYIGTRHAYGTLDEQTGVFVEREHAGYDEDTRRPLHRYRVWPAGAESPDDAEVRDESPFPPKPSVQDYEWSAHIGRYREGSGRQVPHRKPVMVPNPDKCYVGRSEWLTAERGEDGLWRWETHRHWLGDSLFRARVTERTVTEEWGPAVERGQDAWDLGYDSVRSGHHPEHGASPYPHGGWAFNARTKTRRRWAYFLSSFDYNEARPLYFLCELPRREPGTGRPARPTTVEEAYELLKPVEVLAAEAQGLEVFRQGDVFAIPTDFTTREVKALLRRGERVTKRRHVLGTEHSCSEVALLKDGLTVGRGSMYHDVGAFRERDHARKRMGDGKTWHLLVRNTVPRQR